MEDKFNYDVVCLYHKNCIDGLAAGWVVWKFHEGQLDMFAVQYGDKFEETFGKDFEHLIGKKVICVDFAFDLPTTKLLKGICELIVLDHHDTAQRDLASIANPSSVDAKLKYVEDHNESCIVVDNRHSGARLAWNWFYNPDKVPTPILYVEDYDLWKFNYGCTKAWVAAAFSGEMTVEQFDTYVSFDHEEQADINDRLVIEGKAIQRFIDKNVRGLARSARRFMIDDYDVPIVNANSVFRNELGNLLSHDESFSVTYSEHRDGRQYSLRSRKGGVHVGDIAKRFGGGGHANSAAFSIKVDDPQYAHAADILKSGRYLLVNGEWALIENYPKTDKA